MANARFEQKVLVLVSFVMNSEALEVINGINCDVRLGSICTSTIAMPIYGFVYQHEVWTRSSSIPQLIRLMPNLKYVKIHNQGQRLEKSRGYEKGFKSWFCPSRRLYNPSSAPRQAKEVRASQQMKYFNY